MRASATVCPGSNSTVADSFPTVTRAVAAEDPADDPAAAISMRTVAMPRSPSIVTVGCTESSRTPDQLCRETGRQRPTVATSGPQSQPKLQAILRMELYG